MIDMLFVWQVLCWTFCASSSMSRKYIAMVNKSFGCCLQDFSTWLGSPFNSSLHFHFQGVAYWHFLNAQSAEGAFSKYRGWGWGMRRNILCYWNILHNHLWCGSSFHAPRPVYVLMNIASFFRCLHTLSIWHVNYFVVPPPPIWTDEIL